MSLVKHKGHHQFNGLSNRQDSGLQIYLISINRMSRRSYHVSMLHIMNKGQTVRLDRHAPPEDRRGREFLRFVGKTFADPPRTLRSSA